MIIPWQQLAPETLDNIIQEFVLREGTDYGEQEVTLADKIDQVRLQLIQGEVVLLFSELHETLDIRHRSQLNTAAE